MLAMISVCEYFVHTECQDFAVADCKENATYLPGKDLAQVKHTHHWREGNLPSSSKCAVCKKNCFSAECLSGFRCEWCGMTVNVPPLSSSKLTFRHPKRIISTFVHAKSDKVWIILRVYKWTLKYTRVCVCVCVCVFLWVSKIIAVNGSPSRRS